MSGFVINPFVFTTSGGGGAGLAIDSTATGGAASGLTSHTVDIPTGSGGILVILFRASRATSSSSVNAPTGWTKATSGATAGGELAVLYRVSDGSEGATVAVTLTAAAFCSWVAHRISGSETTGTFLEATVGAISATTADPPSLTPSWGSAENLWLAVGSTRRTDNDFTAAPTDYGGLVTGESSASSTSSNDSRIASSYRVLTATSEDPGVFTTSGTVNGIYAATVAILAA